MPDTTNLPLASTLLDIVGNEEISPSVKRTARMLYTDLVADVAAQAGASSVFGSVGGSHSTGLVPDPGLGTSPAVDRVLFDDATWDNGSRLRVAAQFDPRTAEQYGGRVIDLEDYGIVPDYLIGGAVNGSATNNGPALQALVDDLESFDTIIFPPGFVGVGNDIIFPQDISNIGIVSRGGNGNLVKTHNSNNDVSTATPFFHLPSQGTYMRGIWFWAASGTIGGIGFGHAGIGGSPAPEQWRIYDCVVTAFGTGHFFGDCMIEGSDGPSNYGSRVCLLSSCVFHGGYIGFGARIGGVNNCRIIGCDFVNGGSVSVADLWVLGAATNTTNDIMVICSTVDNLLVDRCNAGHFIAGAAGNVTVSGNCSSNLLQFAFISGTITDSGTATRIETPLWTLVNAANDVAAAAAGVEVGEFYRNGNDVLVRIA